MRRIFLSLLLAMPVLWVAVSCGKEGGPDEPQQPVSSISLNPSSLLLRQEGETQRVSVKANGKWALNGSVPWLQISPETGEGDGIISFTVEENPDTDERNATLTLVCGDASATINVTQKQKDALTLTSDRQVVDAEGGTVDIEVKANVNYSVEIDPACAGWITRSETKSMTTTHVLLDVAQNVDFEKREGRVTISDGNLSEVVTIYQAGSGPLIVLGQNEYILPSSEGTFKVEVSSNVEVVAAIQEGVAWLSKSQTKSMSTNTFHYSVSANDTDESRSAEIVFSNAANGLREVVTVTQLPKSAIIVAKSAYEIGSDGGTLTLPVQHNTQYTVSISDDWITRGQTKAMQTTDEVFTIEPNDAYDPRTATITVTSSDNTVSQTITVTQKQLDAVIAEKENLDIKGEGGEFEVKLQSNAKYTVEISDATWIHQITEQTKSMVANTLRFAADANYTGEDRTGWIRIKVEGSDKVTAIKVSQPATEMAQSNSVYNVGPEGGYVNVNLVTNIPFYTLEITPAEASYWLSQSNTKSTRTDVLTFNVAKNIEYESREATVTVRSNSTGEAVTSFIIKQNPQPIPGNTIIYTTKYDTPITLKVTSGYGANYMADRSSYNDGIGILFFDNDIKTIPANAFSGIDNLTSVILPGGTQTVGSKAFFNCSSMIDLTVPESVTSIDGDAMSGCTGTLHFNCTACESMSGNLFTTIEIGPDVTVMPVLANSTELRNIVFLNPDNIKSLPEKCFQMCYSLETIALPDGIETIGASAFAYCSALKIANLGSNLSSIGDYAFYHCNNLKDITIMSVDAPSLPRAAYIPFSASGATLNFPDGAEWSYACQGFYKYFPTLPSISYQELSLDNTSKTATFRGEGIKVNNAIGGETFEVKVYCYTSSSYRGAQSAVIKDGECTVNGLDPEEDFYYWCSCSINYNGKEYIWKQSAVTPPLSYTVDLGLSVKWASCNIDGFIPSSRGGLYRWADLVNANDDLSVVLNTNVPYYINTGSGDSTGWTKYNTQSSRGAVDNKTVLDLEDDVAHVRLGGNWRMPTDAEWQELIDNCVFAKTEMNGVTGFRATSTKSGYTENSIFLPAAGYIYNGDHRDYYSGYYWSSSLDTGSPDSARGVCFGSNSNYYYNRYRYLCRSVRAVTK